MAEARGLQPRGREGGQSQVIIEVNDLRKRYGRLDVLHGLDFGVAEGSAFALVGPNGAGKTTTIKILVNLIEPSRGRAHVLGVDSTSLGPRQLADIGYVSENQELPGRLTVAGYLAYLRPFYPRWDRALEARLCRDMQLPPARSIRASPTACESRWRSSARSRHGQGSDPRRTIRRARSPRPRRLVRGPHCRPASSRF